MGIGHAFEASKPSPGLFVEAPGHIHRFAATVGQGLSCGAVGLFGTGHGFAEKKINASRHGFDHVPVNRGRLGRVRNQVGAIAFRQWRERAGHPDCSVAVIGCLASEARCECGQFNRAFGNAGLGEVAGEGRGGVGRDDIGARIDVFPVDLSHEFGTLE